jgi:transposase
LTEKSINLAGKEFDMLNTLPATIVPAPRHIGARAPVIHRRRGGQPSNRNALKHGFYARKNSSPLATLSTLPAPTTHSRPILDRDIDIFSLGIMELRLQADQLFQVFLKAETARSKVANLNLLVNTVNAISRLGVAMSQQEQPARDLHSVTEHALAYILNDFRDHGIHHDTDSFLEKKEKSDFNSFSVQDASWSGFYFITASQWHVLEPLLPPPHRTSRRGRPSADPRRLLDAIFWKLAHHARWQDLPVWSPPMLTCRCYYRRLFLSGRLATLYTALFKDLQSRGKVALTAFAESGCFLMTPKQVVIRPAMKASWQVHTALLFVQQAYQALRSIRQQKVADRRRRFPTLRMLLKQKARQEQRDRLKSIFSYTPIDLGNLGIPGGKDFKE